MFRIIKELFLSGQILRLSMVKPENINPNGVPRSLIVSGERPVIQTIMGCDEFSDGSICKIHRREQVNENMVEDGFAYVIVPRSFTPLFKLLELCDFECGRSFMKDNDEINAFFDHRWRCLVEMFEALEVEQKEYFRVEIARLLKSWPGELKGKYVQELEPLLEPGSFDEVISFLRMSYGGHAVFRGDPKIFYRKSPMGFKFPVDGYDFFLQKVCASGELLFVSCRKDGDAVYAVIR